MHSPENGFVQLLPNANLQVTATFLVNSSYILEYIIINVSSIAVLPIANLPPITCLIHIPCINVCIIVNKLLRKLGVTAYFYRKNSLSFFFKLMLNKPL